MDDLPRQLISVARALWLACSGRHGPIIAQIGGRVLDRSTVWPNHEFDLLVDMEPVPKTLNWVKARSECSISHLFLLLGEVVKSDTENAKGIPRPDAATFKCDGVVDGAIVVAKMGQLLDTKAVVFERTDYSIIARSGDKTIFTAKPDLSERGSCRLRIDGQSEPLELWQVSRLALEDLFFA